MGSSLLRGKDKKNLFYLLGKKARAFLQEYFRASLIILRASMQSCELDGSHSRRGGTSWNETGGM